MPYVILLPVLFRHLLHKVYYKLSFYQLIKNIIKANNKLTPTNIDTSFSAILYGLK